MRCKSTRADQAHVTAQYYGDTFVCMFPDGKLVSGMSNTGDTGGLCTNAAGDVFITTQYAIYEYAHGRATQIATLKARARGGPSDQRQKSGARGQPEPVGGTSVRQR